MKRPVLATTPLGYHGHNLAANLMYLMYSICDRALYMEGSVVPSARMHAVDECASSAQWMSRGEQGIEQNVLLVGTGPVVVYIRMVAVCGDDTSHVCRTWNNILCFMLLVEWHKCVRGVLRSCLTGKVSTLRDAKSNQR